MLAAEGYSDLKELSMKIEVPRKVAPWEACWLETSASQGGNPYGKREGLGRCLS